MTYNLHPIFVHFPIALLVLYSIIKVVPLRRWFPAVSWKDIERILLVIGITGGFAALSSGETAEHLTRPNHGLVDAHSLFATAAVWMYSALLVGELLSILTPRIVTTLTSSKIIKIVVFFRDLLTHSILSTVLAILGLIAISVTGVLGGVMVYGTSADPIAPIVLKILGISL